MSELLVFDGEELDGPIAAEDLSPLRSASFRGSNRVLPGVEGRMATPRRIDALDQTLVFAVTGRFDTTGAPHADREIGLEQNLEHYRALFTAPGDPDTGEHPVELRYAGAVFTGGIQVNDYTSVRTGPETAQIVLRVNIPAGGLVEVGS